MEFLKAILAVIGVVTAGTLFLIAGADAAIKCVTYHACKNTYSQTANYVMCKEGTSFETLIQKVRMEK